MTLPVALDQPCGSHARRWSGAAVGLDGYICQRCPTRPPSPVAPVSREAADASTPPMLKHWREVKAQHPQTILFYRVGDFYEMFHEDAELAARVLEITLTSRGDGVPLAGVPVKAAAEYLRQLVGAGYRVAICEQVEDPQARPGPGAPRGRGDRHPGRDAAGRLDSPGARNNWILVALAGSGATERRCGLAAIDLSTGEFVLETLDAGGPRGGARAPRAGGDRDLPDDLALALRAPLSS